MLTPRRIVLVLLLALALAPGTRERPADSGESVGPPPFGTLHTLDAALIQARADQNLTVLLPVGSRLEEARLQHDGPRQANVTLEHVVDGEDVVEDLGGTRTDTYRGRLVHEPGSTVAVTLDGTTVRGSVMSARGWFLIQPVHGEDGTVLAHWAYEANEREARAHRID